VSLQQIFSISLGRNTSSQTAVARLHGRCGDVLPLSQKALQDIDKMDLWAYIPSGYGIGYSGSSKFSSFLSSISLLILFSLLSGILAWINS